VGKAVRTTPQADLHILELDSWWRATGTRHPICSSRNLTIALRTISAVPAAGKLYPHPQADVRRFVLRATRNHVYYVERDDYVLVVAVWGAVKDSGPDLSLLGDGR
jgi:hypothetical protein